jgi:hypothetical protein
MSHESTGSTGEAAVVRSKISVRAAVVLLLVLGWHGWMTFTLLCPDRSWKCLIDERPILSGSHPLHLYHGYLGARSFLQRGSVCCYDPAFQAGYPKTPTFDGGSRPAELFLALAGGQYRPAAYKIGFFTCCLIAPLILLGAARGFGLGAGASALVVCLSLLTWWGSTCRNAINTGDLDLVLGALFSVAFVTGLIAFDRSPRIRIWLGLLLAGSAVWFTHQLLALLLSPVVLVYYLSVGAKHRTAWHLALAGSVLAALLVNGFWLPSWFTSWWMHLPIQFEGDLPLHHTLHTLWDSPVWGDSVDRLLAALIFGFCAIGLVLLNEFNRRAAARTLGIGAIGFLMLSLGGTAWRPLGRLGSSQLYLPALWFGMLPAVYALVHLSSWLTRRAGNPANGVALVGCLVAALGTGAWRITAGQGRQLVSAPPLTVGVTDDERAVAEKIMETTTPEARILWEEHSGRADSSHWTALLPILTNRAFIGGLGPELCIEHSFPRLVDQALAGRSLRETSDAELEQFCRRYNIGWVVCRSPETAARLRACPTARLVSSLPSLDPGWLFDLRARSYVLKGQARILQANSEKIALADVIPEDGKVVLSFHYQTGMHVSPGRVQIEREPDARDPVPFIRLRMPDPASRLTITWDGR